MPPVAVSVVEYAMPGSACGSDDVVMVNVLATVSVSVLVAVSCASAADGNKNMPAATSDSTNFLNFIDLLFVS
jgi:hypothetical protein